jgi:hypothetical protein
MEISGGVILVTQDLIRAARRKLHQSRKPVLVRSFRKEAATELVARGANGRIEQDRDKVQHGAMRGPTDTAEEQERLVKTEINRIEGRGSRLGPSEDNRISIPELGTCIARANQYL